REPRTLQRAGDGPRIAQRVTAGAVDGLTAPKLRDDLEPLVEERRAFRVSGLLSERRELHPRVRAEPHAERHPSAREVIERHRLSRHLPWTATRERRHHRSDPDALRRDGDRREGDPRVCHRGVSPKEVVPHEEPVPAGCLRVAGEIGEEAWIAVGAEVLDAEAEAHAQPTWSSNQ